MIKAGSISKGMFLKWHGEPVLVADKEFFNPGKGTAVVRLKLKGVKTGSVVKEVLKTDERVEEIRVEHKRLIFAYKNGNQFVFMDPRTYEQFEVDSRAIGEAEKFVQANKEYGLIFWEGQAISMSLPKKMIFTITKTERAVKGNTVTGATKLATLNNGATVKVPLFIKEGEEVIVSTETGEYISRKK